MQSLLFPVRQFLKLQTACRFLRQFRNRDKNQLAHTNSSSSSSSSSNTLGDDRLSKKTTLLPSNRDKAKEKNDKKLMLDYTTPSTYYERVNNWSSEWAALKVDALPQQELDSISLGTEVPYSFRPAASADPEGITTRLTYSDFVGLRYPVIKKIDSHSNEIGVAKLKRKVFPLYLPAYRRLHPALRELIAFLNSLDPIRFSQARLAERYSLDEKTVSIIVARSQRERFIRDNRLSKESLIRLSELEAVNRQKEEAYAARLGYDLKGNQKMIKRKQLITGTGGGKKVTDVLLRQQVQVEAMSAFPLPSLRDPTTRKFEIDFEVKADENYRILNWVDPTDKVVI